MKFTAREICQATRGTLLVDGPAGALCTDTRAVRPGDWFVALRGPRFDGHDFVEQAGAAGAIGAIVERPIDGWEGGLVQVPDTTRAYGVLGRAARRRLGCPVVGLTGTSGKTTTRALIALAISDLGVVHQTRENLNNHLGVPLTLLAAPPEPDAVVVELGTSGPGEIATLSKIAEPTHRLILNIGHGHLLELGDIEGVGREKRALFDTARPGDVALVNLDDPRLVDAVLPAGVERITFGRSEAATVRLMSVALDPDRLVTRMTVRCEGVSVQVTVSAFGLPFAHNALAALAVAHALGVPLDAAAAHLDRYEPVGMRQRIERLPNGALVINDAYNANPDSVAAALRTLANLGGSRIAVLGDMLELGTHRERLHTWILDLATELDIERVVVLGERFADAAAGRTKVRVAPTVQGALDILGDLAPDDRVLVKGSRGMRLERIVQGLITTPPEAR